MTDRKDELLVCPSPLGNCSKSNEAEELLRELPLEVSSRSISSRVGVSVALRERVSGEAVL